MEEYSIWLTLGGIGLLLYGMILMEEVIKKLVKSSLQKKLETYTKNKRYSFLLGLGVTGATQSSTLVSLLLLAFVGAGIVSLPSAFAVIAGSNIGTTFSSLLIALLGFGQFSIATFALPLIAIGGIGLLFVSHKKTRYYLKLFLSFGLLFFGIDLIKESVEALKAVIDFTNYVGFGIVGFFLVGVILTAVIQSSHTVVIMTLAALHGGIITFPMALGIVIGSNIGTTGTVLFASLGSNYLKKNVAFAHLGFNLILSVIGLLYYPGIVWFITDVLGIDNNPIIALALFNMLLNTVTALILLPFLDQFVIYVQKMTARFKKEKQLLHTERFLGSEKYTNEFPSIILQAIFLDTKDIFKDTIRYILQMFAYDQVTTKITVKKTNVAHRGFLARVKTWLGLDVVHEQERIEHDIASVSYNQQVHKELYDTTKNSIETVLPRLLQLQQQELSQDESIEQEMLESLINSSIEIMKYGKAIWKDMDALRHEHNDLHTYYKDRQQRFVTLCSAMIVSVGKNTGSTHQFRNHIEEHKKIYKSYRDKKHHIVDTHTIKSSIPLSTLFNIDRHLLLIEKTLLKAWKTYGKVTADHINKSLDALVDELYDEEKPG